MPASNKSSVSGIVRRHFDTLRDNRTGKTSIADIFWFFGVPALVGASAPFWHLAGISILDYSRVLIPVSVFGAALAVISVALTFLTAKLAQPGHWRILQLLRETNANALYAALVCLTVFVLLLVPAPWYWAEQALLALTVASLTNLILTLTMIFKRLGSISLEASSGR